MLYVGCSNCRRVDALWCAGRFMPHPPVYVEPSPMGPYCGYCGPLPTIFTCFYCGAVQAMYMPGMTTPQLTGPGSTQLVAPAFQAAPGASQAQVNYGLKQAADTFLGAAGKEVGHQAASFVAAWLSSP
jgi:hypothetical protein